ESGGPRSEGLMWRALVGDIRSPGSSESRLFAVAVRFGLLAKLVTVGLCTVLGVVATTGSARTAIAVIGSSLVVWLLLRLRGLPDAIALCGDVALAALVGLSAFWLGPPTVISWGARVAFLCAVVAHYDWASQRPCRVGGLVRRDRRVRRRNQI